jgi:hypothetical protein
LSRKCRKPSKTEGNVRLSEKKRAYLAGIVDARCRFGWLGAMPFAEVRTRSGIPKEIHSIFGGSLFTDKEGCPWVKLYGPRAVEFLKVVMPYLRQKREAAEGLVARYSTKVRSSK